MTRRSPSLNQLRAFEAAARHESIKMGAVELCVTPAAVGHQIKALELELNTALFRRMTRKIGLTHEGRVMSEHLGIVLDASEDAVALTRKSDMTGILKITIAPFFGNRWLLARLPEFHKQHPGIEIKSSLSFDYVDLGKSCALICNDVVSPVRAPQLINGRQLPLSVHEIFGPTTGQWFTMARRLAGLGKSLKVKKRLSRKNCRIRKSCIHV